MIFLFFAVPLLLSTNSSFSELFGFGFPYFFLGLTLLTDAFVNINTGYYLNGHLVENKYTVFRNYAKKLLLIDFVGILPLLLYMLMQDTMPKQFLFCYFIKYKSVTKIFKRLELRLDLKASLLHKIALLKLFSTVLYIAHLFANFWLYLATMNDNMNWLKRID